MKLENFPILVSLPKNDIDLVKGAIDGGAHGVKVHLNAFHHASGNHFGSFEEELPFLQELSKLDVMKLVMIGQEELPTPKQMLQLRNMGFEGFNLYLKHLQPEVLQSGMTPIPALENGYTLADIERIRKIPGALATASAATTNAVIEASVIHKSKYGEPLKQEDLETYSQIVRDSKLPVIVPSQKKILPEDLGHLKETGVAALLIGVIVTGSTPQSIRDATRAFVKRR